MVKVIKSLILNDLDTKMTGEERYPVLRGGTVRTNIIQSKFKGLSLYGSCVEKNWIARSYLPSYVMVMGAVRVISADGNGAYGHDFNPPTELHAWLVNRNGSVVDFALPGLILAGSILSDEKGPYIVGREPAILVGVPPAWVLYRIHHIIDDAKVNQALGLSTRYNV